MATAELPHCGHPAWLGTYRACPRCEGERNRLKVDELAEAIRDAKAAPNREARIAALKKCERLGHPDIDGFRSYLEGQ